MQALVPIDTEGAAVRLAETLFNKGIEALERSRFAAAESSFRGACNLDPIHPFYESYLGWTILHNTRRESAERFAIGRDHLEQALERNPTSAIGHYYLARCYQAMKDWDGAARHLRAAILHRPDFPEARTELDRVVEEIGEQPNEGRWSRLTRWLRKR